MVICSPWRNDGRSPQRKISSAATRTWRSARNSQRPLAASERRNASVKLRRDEIKLRVFIALALLVGSIVKTYRRNHPIALPARAARTLPAPKAAVDLE